MTEVQNVGVITNQTQTTAKEGQKKYALIPSFKAQNDSFTHQLSPQQQQQKAIEDYQKEQKKQKTKQNISLAVSIGAGIAIIASVVMGIISMKKGGFNISNLEFKNLANDDTVFNLKETKSLHPKVKNFFTELLDKGAIPKEMAERAGILGEGGTNSILLLGNSGVGKTEVIRAYAKAANADYVAIKVSDFSNSYINGTSKNISEMINALIKRARSNPNKQLVISLDEVDALVKVTAQDTSGEIAKNRQSLLTGIDELLKLPNVKLFTSSNANVKDLDGAFLRRCGYNFTVPMPDKEQLREALKFQLRKCKGATENDGEFFKETNKELDSFLDMLVDRQCAFGDIANIAKGAKDKYALDMWKSNSPNKKFSVDYLTEVLNNIETTAGEKALREGSALGV